jgi:hypothetical protein
MSTQNLDIASARTLGDAIARKTISLASDVFSFAASVKAANAHAEFTAYTTFRAEFVAGAAGAGYQAADDLWLNTWKQAKALGHLGDAPKSAAPAAQAKAAQREAAKAAEKADTRTPAELRTVADKLAKEKGAAGAAEAAKLVQLAEKKEKEASRAAAEKVAEKVKPQLEKLSTARDVLKKANDLQGLTLLAKVAELLAAGQHAKVSAAIKGLKVPAKKEAEPAPM